MTPREQRRARAMGLLVGIGRVARGRKDGLLQFGDTAESVLSALAPWTALLLVLAVLGLLTRDRDAVENVAISTVLLLCPLVLSFEFARRWGRAREWFRFATAYCWAQWVSPVIVFGVMVIISLLLAFGANENVAVLLGLLLLLAYAVWLTWFVARHALAVSAGRAALLTACVLLGSSLIASVPMIADYAVTGAEPSANGPSTP